jgi:hypothetical protein
MPLSKIVWVTILRLLLSCSIFIAIPAMQYGEKTVCSFEINALALKTVTGKKWREVYNEGLRE